MILMSDSEESGTMKYWNFGNTTVRNPDRILKGFLLFRQYFEGKPWLESDQRRFSDLLIEAGLATIGKGAAPTSKGIAGRKWASIFHKFGLKRWKPTSPVRITEIGELYANGKITEEEFFLRQLLKFRFPSPYDKEKDYLGFDVHPFFVILKIALELNSVGLIGISREELSLYVVTCLRDEDISDKLQQIKEFRKQFDSTKGLAAKRELFHKKKVALLAELHKDQLASRRSLLKILKEKVEKNRSFGETKEGKDLLKRICAGGKGSNTPSSLNVQKEVIRSLLKDAELGAAFAPVRDFFLDQRSRTLNDYADTAVRYSMKTGLFSNQKNKLAIKKSRLLFAQSIVKGFRGTTIQDFDMAFYDPKMPELPYEKEDFLLKETSYLLEQYLDFCKKLKLKPEIPTEIPKEEQEVRAYRTLVEKKLRSARQTDFSTLQNTPEEAADIESIWENIQNRTLLGGEAYMPAYFEWVIWRIFLAINSILNPIAETRSFDVDEEMNPLSHAQAGKPDMLFDYEDFILVCEATLAGGSAQWAREYESVPRHVAQLAMNTKKKVFGIFIAPKIDPNQAQQLFRQTWFSKNDEMILDIIPLEMDLVIQMLRDRVQGKFDVTKLRKLLDQAIALKAAVKNGKEWYSKVKEESVKMLEN